jgi:nucleolin
MSNKNQNRRPTNDDDSDVEQELQNKKLRNNGGAASNGYKKSSGRRDHSEDSDSETEQRGKAGQKADKKYESKNKRESDGTGSEEEEKKGGNKGTYEVIIKGLPFASGEQDITEFFQGCGDIENVNVLKGHDGRSKGIAFVKFSDEKSVQKAIALTETELGGRTVHIEKTVPKEQRSAGGDRDRNQQRAERDPNSTTVFIGNLSYSTDETSIRKLFDSCGKITEVRVTMGQDGRPRGFGYVEFSSADSVDKAISKTGADLDGRAVRVDFANSKRTDGGGSRSFGGGRNGGGSYGGGRDSYGGGRSNGGGNRRGGNRY